MALTRLPDDHMASVCPFHDNCLEGLASGPALARRAGCPAEQLPPDHPVWQRQARYLAMMCANLVLLYSPERIVLGGGVMQQRHLLTLIRRLTGEYLGAYCQNVDLSTLIVAAALGSRAGALGGLLLAQQARQA